MKDYLNEINDRFPVRKTESEKEAFRGYVLAEAERLGRFAVVEREKKHQNIVIGDIARAKVLFTAHYDTPATSPIPNFMLPRSRFLWIVSHFTFPTMLGVACWFLGWGLAALLTETLFLKILLGVLFYLGLLFAVFFLLTRGFKNKHNKNDNTSGTAAVLSLMERCASEKAAFVLFDNEEKGLLGSKAFRKKHDELLKDKLVVNFDCVGAGDQVLFIGKEDAEAHPLFQKLKAHNPSKGGYTVSFFPAKGTHSASDHKSFACGVGVLACKKKGSLYYAGKIHTNRDTEADPKNIGFLAANMLRFIEEA